jgi:predicted amidohydrolase
MTPKSATLASTAPSGTRTGTPSGALRHSWALVLTARAPYNDTYVSRALHQRARQVCWLPASSTAVSAWRTHLADLRNIGKSF